MWSRSITGWSEKWTFRLHVPQHSANGRELFCFQVSGEGERGGQAAFVHSYIYYGVSKRDPRHPASCLLSPAGIRARNLCTAPLATIIRCFCTMAYATLRAPLRPGDALTMRALDPKSRPRFFPLSVPLRHSLARCRTGARAAPQTFTCWWKNLQTHGNGGTCNTWRCTCVRGIPTAVTLTS